jgi:coatomer protein complex subunit alpha (xenin)
VDDVAIPADVVAPDDGEDSQFYAVPQRGQPPSFYWPNNSSLVADHLAAGSFRTAGRLLNDHLGITRLEPFKQLFLSVYARSKAAYNGLPLSSPNFVYPLRNWQEAGLKNSNGLPAVGLKLNELAEKLQVSC